MKRGSPLLPPPAATILLYAADGLSVWRKNFSPSGNPRTPERIIWVPMFRELVKSPEGLRTLRKLAETGMQAWRCPPDTVNCLKDAFHDITIRALMLATLEHFAETARERVLLTVPPPPRPYPSPARPTPPRPERPNRTPSATPPSGPHRPSPKRNSPGPQLG